MSYFLLMVVPSYFDFDTNIAVYSAYAYYKGQVVLPRACLAQFPALWHPLHRNKIIAFLNHLNAANSFLEEHETAQTFILTYKFGQSLQHYRHRFLLPKNNPIRWWDDGYHFTEQNCYGLHESFKPFFKVLCVALSKDAYMHIKNRMKEHLMVNS